MNCRSRDEPKNHFCVALVLSTGLAGCSTARKSPHQRVVTYGGSERPDILSYSTPSPQSLRRIKVARVSLTKEGAKKLEVLSKTKSENGVRWLVEERPNTMRDGPWNTRLSIVDAAEPSRCVRVELLDHANGGVHSRWLNDKMLLVRVWFGRIAWTDLVLDTETLRFAYIEDGRLDAVLDGREE